MKFSWHAVAQVLATLLQVLNFASGVVPAKYQPWITFGLSVVQASIALVNQFYNPDGTPAKVAWVAKVLILCLLLSAPAFAQTPPPTCSLPLDFCESAWTVNVFGNYSSLTNAPTNNGFESGAGIRFAPHWSGEIRYFMTASPSGKILVAGPQFDYGLAHIIKPTANFDSTNVDLFVHASPGLSWSSGTDSAGNAINGAKKFAFAVGGGADYMIPSAPSVTLRIIEVSYVYSPLFPTNGQFIGNHLQVGAGLRLVFGGTSTPAAQARRASAKLRKQQSQAHEN